MVLGIDMTAPACTCSSFRSHFPALFLFPNMLLQHLRRISWFTLPKSNKQTKNQKSLTTVNLYMWY